MIDLLRSSTSLEKSNDKRTILYVITKSELGGAQSHILELIRSFHQDYTVHLAVGEVGALTKSVEALATVHFLPSLVRNIDGLADLLAFQQCISLIRTIQPALIHAHSSKAGVIGRLAGWICGVPTIFTAHGWGFTPNTPQTRQKIAHFVERKLVSITTKLICVSEIDRQLALDEGIGNSDTLVRIYNGIEDREEIIANPSLDPPRLIMVARFSEQKDQATLLRAIARLQSESFSLDFVGSGDQLASCQQLAESLGVRDRVSFLGDRQDVPELLARSQVFVLSTHYEGLPISILEAMRSGLPIVATAVNGIPEEVIHGQTGLLVPHGDVQALADALLKIIRCPKRRAEMGKAGRDKFLREFTLETMIHQLRQVYQAVIPCSRLPRK